jgi:hypothetical protein
MHLLNGLERLFGGGVKPHFLGRLSFGERFADVVREIPVR